MSAIKHAPATPLPLELRGEGLNLKIVGADGSDADDVEGSDQNIKYAVHAANAYPKLIEALRSGIASLEQFVSIGRIPENNQGLRDMRALLLELGEAS